MCGLFQLICVYKFVKRLSRVRFIYTTLDYSLQLEGTIASEGFPRLYDFIFFYTSQMIMYQALIVLVHASIVFQTFGVLGNYYFHCHSTLLKLAFEFYGFEDFMASILSEESHKINEALFLVIYLL